MNIGFFVRSGRKENHARTMVKVSMGIAEQILGLANFYFAFNTL